MRRQTPKAFALFALLFLIAACGQKGDLYLPDHSPEKVKTKSKEN